MVVKSAESEQTLLASFYGDLERFDLQPLWTQSERLMPKEPKPASRPWLWKWSVLEDLGQRAGELITIDRGGDRRVLSLSNPGLGGAPFATSTLWAAIQYLGPHESAPGHRHTPGAVRFVLEGEGVWTTVNGDACDMRAGDLILTPSWSWHDHNNMSDKAMIWFDGLDLPTVIALDAVFFEPFQPDELQTVRGHNISERIYGRRVVIPSLQDGAAPNSPLLVYRWTDTLPMLEAMATETPSTQISLEYINPTNGQSVLPTLACEMHLLRSGPSPTRRKVGSSVFVAFQGNGYSVVDGIRFDWGKGDMFAVPSWAPVTHVASEDSYLFAISDAPILKALNLFRTTEVGEPQKVRSTFSPKL